MITDEQVFEILKRAIGNSCAEYCPKGCNCAHALMWLGGVMLARRQQREACARMEPKRDLIFADGVTNEWSDWAESRISALEDQLSRAAKCPHQELLREAAQCIDRVWNRFARGIVDERDHVLRDRLSRAADLADEARAAREMARADFGDR